MPSRRQTRRARKLVAQSRRALASPSVRHPLGMVIPAPSVAEATTHVAPPEPKILSEEIGSLASIGVSQATITYLHKGGIHFVRDIPAQGKARLLETRGMGQARLYSLESALRPYGVTIPA